MFEIKQILKVPESKDIRDKLRDAVRLYFSKTRVLPPSGLETLEKHSAIILGEMNFDPVYLGFTIVLAGNEIWRETVAAVPFNRRLLLLPQCLKNQLKCKAVVDELGLICAGCGNCMIDSILDKAEGLGYSTLVAEGTTVAISLVEEGAIDAVFGVSCMPVLQKSFEPVTKAAIPAIGIPLLYDGCINTSPDYEWLFEEIEAFSGNKEKQPLSVSSIKNKVNSYFSGDTLTKYFKPGNDTGELALKTMKMGGQRIRPLLAAMAYQSYTQSVSNNIMEQLAIIVECFHKASLIHDDIEDGDDERYSQETIHKSEGVAVAINVGDYLIGKGYSILANLEIDEKKLTRCFRVVSESHMKLSEGQGDDISIRENISKFTVEDIFYIFKQKTGEALKVSLLLGAFCGNAPEADIACLSAFSEYFGIAYQIRDDLNEFREKNSLKHAFNFPFLLVLLSQMVKNAGGNSEVLVNFNDLPGLTMQIEKFKVEGKAGVYLDNYIERCYEELDKLGNRKLRLGLYVVMGKVFKNPGNDK